MFKANNDVSKKNGFLTFDQNKLYGWKHDGWTLASGQAFTIDLLGNMGKSVGPVQWSRPFGRAIIILYIVFPGKPLANEKWRETSCIGIYLLYGKFRMAAVDGAIWCHLHGMTFLGHDVEFPYGTQQSKVWQGISCFALVRFATKTSRCSQEGT